MAMSPAPRNAYQLILQERDRQIAKGYTREHDDEHGSGEIALAAACFAAGEDLVTDGAIEAGVWPWKGQAFDALEGKSRLEQLVIAGALIVAEIERLQRAGAK